ncbi:conserved protein of unknown function [Pseudodesulfovibrio profundus]|uniref:LA2681-like HEPN domain-containing protein n=2 Tax=Pseudodesulfovibrio profundus TaxID=57320 RepID=A0A2C8FF42_9BACT|nr:conserved protein of unknown function [Pseudodesulfovibrio profundus]
MCDLSERCDAAIESRSQEKIDLCIEEIQLLAESNKGSLAKAQLSYYLGNLFNAKSDLSNERTHLMNGPRPVNLMKALEHRRKSFNLSREKEDVLHELCQVNLSNSYFSMCRYVESLELLDGYSFENNESKYVGLCRQIFLLDQIEPMLDDDGHAEQFAMRRLDLFNRMYDERKEIQHPGVLRYISAEENVKYNEKLTFFFKDTKRIEALSEKPSYSPDEMSYREWCLENRLFLNPLNIISDLWIADRDILQFPSYMVELNEGPYLAASFSSIKREYCFARFLCYDGLFGHHPGYEENWLFFTNTGDEPSYGGDIEKLKVACRLAYSVCDKLLTLLVFYVSGEKKKVYFRPREIKKIMKNQQAHPALEALFWLSSEFGTDEKYDTGFLSELYSFRNDLEHNYVRVCEGGSSPWDSSSDYARTVTREELIDFTFLSLSTARSALFYLTFFVKSQEEQVEKSGYYLPNPVPYV